jgi:uncharacterized protein YecE (DUF72 family)
LQRYAARLNAAEINSTFYRSHRRQTYERWAQSVASGFRFAVKAPRIATHERRLQACDDVIAAFLDETGALGDRRGPLLIQLPPSLAYDRGVAAHFFTALRRRYDGALAVEPRHASWFEAEADQLLSDNEAARVAADPAKVEAAGRPGGWLGLCYVRLHGSPVMYRSGYDAAAIGRWTEVLVAAGAQARWCIFDNTTLGAAAGDALALKALMG